MLGLLLKKFFEWLNGLNTVFYIVSLPEPLTSEKENQLLERASSGDMTARNMLIEHNLRLVVYIAKRFDNTGVEMEELISIGSVGLMKAVDNYNADKNIKLATFASRCIENEILMYLRKMVRIRSEVSLDEPLNVDWEGNQLLLSDVLGTESDALYRDMESRSDVETIMKIFDRLNERDKAIVGMRFGLYGMEEKTQKEIADMMNISQSYISRLEKKILYSMRSEFVKNT